MAPKKLMFFILEIGSWVAIPFSGAFNLFQLTFIHVKHVTQHVTNCALPNYNCLRFEMAILDPLSKLCGRFPVDGFV